MNTSSRAPRLGAALIVVAITVLNAVASERYHIVPLWLTYVVGPLMIGPMAMAANVQHPTVWQRIERIAMFVALGLAALFNALNLFDVVDELISPSRPVRPMPLFVTSVAIWIANFLIFTLLYWLIDRGGPDARAANLEGYPDFDFPAMADPTKVPSGWRPGIVDYLFVGFTTTTAFGPTDAMPLTARAKALMIAQSVVSLIAIVVVGARAIGMFE